VDAYRTDDEQVEALKRWWKENGTSTLLGIVVVVGGYFGWQAWETRQAQQAEAASFSYQQLLQLSMEIEQQPTDARYTTASHLVNTLKTDFSSTDYARYAALMQAKLQVSQGDLAEAEAELRWVLDSKPEPSMMQVSNLRLARVLFASGQVDPALALIDSAEHGEFTGSFYELRGDIESSQGNVEAARQAYQRALEQGPVAAGGAPLVRMKLESLPGGSSGDQNPLVGEG
jgi:predicted negative regulator of RcsB-dependent stress response